MQMLTVTNNKGGVGKTAISTILARYAASDDQRVLFLDFDVQGNASYTLNSFTDPEHKVCAFDFFSRDLSDEEVSLINGCEKISVAVADNRLANTDSLAASQAIRQFRSNLARLKTDWVVMDTSPTLSNTLLIATGVSGDVLVPIEPSRFSIEGVKHFITMLLNFRRRLLEADMPCDMRLAGIVVNKMEAGKRRRVKMLEEIRPAFGEHLLKTVIGNRDAIAEAMDRMIDIRELKLTAVRRKARQEFEDLYTELRGRLRDF